MSTKITIKKNEEKYEWSQTEDSILLSFPLKNVTLKNVDVLYTPHFIKINAPSVKYLAIVDFPDQAGVETSSGSIDADNPRNRI